MNTDSFGAAPASPLLHTECTDEGADHQGGALTRIVARNERDGG